MRGKRQTLILLLVAGFTILQFAIFFDDPQHLIEPDPDCAICLAAQTPLHVTQTDTIEFNLEIVFYLFEKSTLYPTTVQHISTFCIRAPPQIIST